MPLFHSSTPEQPAPAPAPAQEPPRSRSLFSRRSNTPEDDYASTTNQSTRTNSTRTGFFGRHRSSSSDRNLDDHPRNDPSIVSGRQKVAEAEMAERDADRALMQARAAVREAKEQVRMLEREAMEESKRAKAKQSEAKNVSKSARALGRHG